MTSVCKIGSVIKLQPGSLSIHFNADEKNVISVID